MCEQATFFQQELHKAFVPLFTIRTVAVRNELLRPLSAKLDNVTQFPIRIEEDGSQSKKHRNMNNFVNNDAGKQSIAEFNDLAKDIMVQYSEILVLPFSLQIIPCS